MKMKKLLISLMVVVMLVIPLVGCTSDVSDVSDDTDDTEGPAETITLRLATGEPTGTVQMHAFEEFVSTIEERTAAIGHPVEITIYPAATLVPEEEHLDALIEGVVDIVAGFGPHDTPGVFPLSGVMELPFMFPSAEIACEVCWELYETTPELADEWASKVKLLWVNPVTPDQFVSNFPLTSLEDFEGRKVRATPGVKTLAVAALGASVVPVSFPEVYEGLERGLVEAACVSWEGIYANSWHEVTEYRTVLPQGLAGVLMVTAMSWDAWNSLPSEVQEIFDEFGGEMSVLAGSLMDAACEESMALIQEYDQTVGNPDFYYLPESEFERWIEAVSSVYTDWIAEVEAEGLPAQEIYDKVRSLTEKYSS